MKYTILINQYAAVKSGLDLDLIDLSIFDFIKDFANSQSCIKIQTPEGIYFWVSHKLVIENMPLLNIKTPQGIIKRIDNLIKADLLTKHPNCEVHSKTLYCFGKNYDLLMFKNSEFGKSEPKLNPLNESLTPPNNVFNAPLNESLGYNTNNIDNIINDNIDTPHNGASLFPDIEKQKAEELKKIESKKLLDEEEKKKKTLFRNSAVFKTVNFNVAPPDYSEFEKLYSGDEYAKIDLVFYFHAASDWSDQKDMKRTKAGWIATIRNFIRGDIDKNKLRLKPEFKPQSQKLDVAGAMDYLNEYD